MTFRTFEYDDYPRGRRRILRLLDDLKHRYPNFKCDVFAIPAEMSPRSFLEIDKRRDFVRLHPHGFHHDKGECRGRRLSQYQLKMLDALAADTRYSMLFKAPWMGYAEPFITAAQSRGFALSCKALKHWPHPMPPGLMVWNIADAILSLRTTGSDDRATHVEAHPIYPPKPNQVRPHKAQMTEISRCNIRKWTKQWSVDDEWVHVESLIRPACLKLHLGCGSNILDGWINLDPRSELDPRITEWDFSRRIPYSECKADIVFTSHVMNYLDDSKYEEALLDVWRVLRPGGVLRMAEDCTDSDYIWRRPGQRARGTGEIKSLPTKERIVHALNRVGFEVHDAEPGETRSPHKDVLLGDSRIRRYRLGHKFYVEAVKVVSRRFDLSHVRWYDKRATLRGRYRLPPYDITFGPS